MSDQTNIKSRQRIIDHVAVTSCPGCGAALYPDDRYCACCGIPTQRLCPACSAPIMQMIANYCSSCGTHLE